MQNSLKYIINEKLLWVYSRNTAKSDLMNVLVEIFFFFCLTPTHQYYSYIINYHFGSNSIETRLKRSEKKKKNTYQTMRTVFFYK